MTLLHPIRSLSRPLLAAALTAALPYAAAQILPPKTAPAPVNTSAASTITDTQKTALNAEAKQYTGKSCVEGKMYWTSKALPSAAPATTGNVIPMPSNTDPQLAVSDTFLAALEKLTSNYSSVTRLGHSQGSKWALIRDRDNLTNLYFAVSPSGEQLAVKFCQLQ